MVESRRVAGRVRTAAGLVLLAGLVPLTGCGSPDVSRARVEQSVGATFGHLYAGAGSPAPTGASASCDRGGPAVPDEGAGDDWACLVSWVDTGGTVRQARYALQMHADGCYKADGELSGVTATGPGGPGWPAVPGRGPTGAVGGPAGSPATATRLGEFDGCTGAG